MILSWAQPLINDLQEMLSAESLPQTVQDVTAVDEHIQCIGLTQDTHVMGFELSRDADLYTIHFLQRSDLDGMSFLPGKPQQKRLLAENIPAEDILPLMRDTLAVVARMIEAAENPAPPFPLSEHYTVYENAIMVPPQLARPGAYHSASGVFTHDGTFIEESLTMSGNRLRHDRVAFPDQPPRKILRGTHAFGGVFFGHFGHFITESTGRLWILGEDAVQVDSIVYQPKAGLHQQHAFQHQQKLLAALGIQATLRGVDGPTLVERLVVPRAGFGLNDDLIDGTPIYANYMRKVAANRPDHTEGPKKLYVSRSRLAFDRGSILGETVIEQLLEAEGYTIWHPQSYSAADQVAHYTSAEHIISMDASPLHLYAYVAKDAQKLAILKRRSQNAHVQIQRHIKAFANPEIRVIDALVADYVPKGTRPGRSSWGEVSLAAVGRELAEMGLISHPERWADIPRADIDQQIEKISKDRERTYTRLPCAKQTEQA